MAQEVLIEFTSDVSGLEPAVDQLEKLGAIDKQAANAFKATNAEIAKRQSTLKATAATAVQASAATKKSINEVDNAVKKLTSDFVEGFQQGVSGSLAKATISAEEFSQVIKEGNNEIDASSKTVKARLREITQQLALLKSQGKDNTEQYRALTAEAGHLNDALGDVSAEIRNAGSDTRVFDTLIGSAQAVAGGFALAQSATALFGEESGALQETLLRVSAVMAGLQGLQAISAALEKEGALSLLATNIQLRVKNAQKIIETALESKSIIVRGAAIVAQKALNAAMTANPIGIFVVAITGLIAILATYGRSAADARRQTSTLNVALADGADAFKEREAAITQAGNAVIESLENEGAVGSKIAQQEIENQRLLVEARKQRIEELQKLQAESPDAELEQRVALSKEIRKLQDQEVADTLESNKLKFNAAKVTRAEELQNIADIAAARLAATVKNSKAELNASKELARAKAAVDIDAAGQNGAEILRIQAELNDQLRDLDRTFNQVRQQDRIAGIEAALIAEQQISQAINARQSQAEIDLQKRLIQEKANLELLQEGLTQNQILQIKKAAQAEIFKVQKDFNKQAAEESLQDFISSNNAQLAAVDITNKEKLNLTIDNIIAQAQVEVQQNEGLSDKIKEINAKRDADIKAARLQSIRQTIDEEIALRAATEGVDVRADEKLLSAQDAIRNAGTEREKKAIEKRLDVRRLTINEELALIDQLAERETANIDTRVDALNDSFAQGLISYKDYNLQYNQLTDQQAQVTEESEQRKRDAIAATEAKAKEQQRKIVDFTIAAARQNLAILEEFYQQQADREQDRIDQQRQRITELQESGAITEKEALARQKKLDQEERKLKIQQAKRNKALAVFGAIISTAQAVATALTAGPPLGVIFAAIYAALGAAQIALILSKPIPAFRKGKKDNYEGPGIVGEAGSELIEKNGQLYVAPKKTIVWLGAKDKVFNPEETRAILEKPGLKPERMESINNIYSGVKDIDYDRLGKAIAKKATNISLNIDGYKDFVIEGQNFNTYLNNRRGYK